VRKASPGKYLSGNICVSGNTDIIVPIARRVIVFTFFPMTRRAIGPMISVYPDTQIFPKRYLPGDTFRTAFFDLAFVTQIGIVSHPLKTPAIILNFNTLLQTIIHYHKLQQTIKMIVCRLDLHTLTVSTSHKHPQSGFCFNNIEQQDLRSTYIAMVRYANGMAFCFRNAFVTFSGMLLHYEGSGRCSKDSAASAASSKPVHLLPHRFQKPRTQTRDSSRG